MKTTINTTVGTVTVTQNSENLVSIRLTSSASHPGNVTLAVHNDGNGDEARLLWIK